MNLFDPWYKLLSESTLHYSFLKSVYNEAKTTLESKLDKGQVS